MKPVMQLQRWFFVHFRLSWVLKIPSYSWRYSEYIFASCNLKNLTNPGTYSPAFSFFYVPLPYLAKVVPRPSFLHLPCDCRSLSSCPCSCSGLLSGPAKKIQNHKFKIYLKIILMKNFHEVWTHLFKNVSISPF